MLSTPARLYLFLFFIFSSLLTSLSFDFYWGVKIITQFFAFSTSPFKVYFFLFYGLLLSVLLLFKVPLRFNSIFLIIPLAALLSNLFLHLEYTYRAGLRVDSFSLAAFGSEQSSNNLSHTHCAKAIMGYLVNLLGLQTYFSSADIGRPYLEILPEYALIPHAILTLVTFFTLIYFVLYLAQFLSLKKIFLSIIASYTVLLRVVDGGLFAPEAMTALSLLIALNQSIKSRNLLIPYFKIFLKFFAVLLLAQLLLFQYISDFFVENTFSCLSFFLLILLIPETLAQWRRAPMIIFLLATLYNNFKESPNSLFWQHLQTAIKPKEIVYLYSKSALPLEERPFYVGSNFKIYKYQVEKEQKFEDLYRNFNIRSNYINMYSESANCSTLVSYSEQVLINTIPRKQALNIVKVPDYAESYKIAPCQDSSCDYRLSLTIKGCMPNPANSLTVGFLGESFGGSYALFSEQAARLKDF